MSEASMKVVIGELKDTISDLSEDNQQLLQQVDELRHDKQQLYEIISHLRQLNPDGYPRAETGYVDSASHPTYAASAMLSGTVASIQGPTSSQCHGYQGQNSWAQSTVSTHQPPMTTQPVFAGCQPPVPPVFP